MLKFPIYNTFDLVQKKHQMTPTTTFITFKRPQCIPLEFLFVYKQFKLCLWKVKHKEQVSIRHQTYSLVTSRLWSWYGKISEAKFGWRCSRWKWERSNIYLRLTQPSDHLHIPSTLHQHPYIYSRSTHSISSVRSFKASLIFTSELSLPRDVPRLSLSQQANKRRSARIHWHIECRLSTFYV